MSVGPGRRGWALAAALALAALVVLSPQPARSETAVPAVDPATEVEVAPPVRISGPTPFTDDCGDPNETGTGTADHEGEPFIAVNPSNPNHLVATWQQDRYTGIGGSRSNLVAVSHSGGRSWSDPKTLPGISTCTGGERFRASDPWVGIGPDGRVYQASMAVNERFGPDAGIDIDGDILVSSSRRGIRWTGPPAVVARDEGVFFEEKPVLAADPLTQGRAFVAWARHTAPDPLIPITPADLSVAFSRTDDGGETWTDPVEINNVPGALEWPTHVLAVPHEGDTVLVVPYVVLTTRLNAVPYAILATTSRDLGATWSPPVVVGAVAGPLSGRSLFPSGAVGPDGTLYYAWNDQSPGGDHQIWLARSEDLGATWDSGVIRSFTHPVSLPTIAVAGDGTVGVFWYDQRNDEDGDGEVTTDVIFASSGDRGETWSETHLAGPFDGGGVFLGDYQGMVGFPDGFGALFAMARPQAETGPTDIYFARIVMGG